jgi:hypothetical protein
MSDPAINSQAVRALLDINVRIADLVCWIEAAPHMMTSEDQAVDVGTQILRRLHGTRELALEHMAALAEAAGVPSAAVVGALEASLVDAFPGGYAGGR